jgi:hypothetical protein
MSHKAQIFPPNAIGIPAQAKEKAQQKIKIEGNEDRLVQNPNPKLHRGDHPPSQKKRAE